MDGYCSTDQSPQRAVVPVEEEEEKKKKKKKKNWARYDKNCKSVFK
jgi:hypothetical protein